MDNPSKIKTQTKASSFTLIVAFICVALIGLALIPLLPVKLNPFENPARFYGAVQYARYFVEGGGNRGYQ